jgi:hypothetical protein
MHLAESINDVDELAEDPLRALPIGARLGRLERAERFDAQPLRRTPDPSTAFLNLRRVDRLVLSDRTTQPGYWGTALALTCGLCDNFALAFKTSVPSSEVDLGPRNGSTAVKREG